jgi:hypothetical protein
MALSTYSSDKLIDHVLRNTAWTMPTNVYVSLHTADPALTGANEEAGGWYARKVASFAAADTTSVVTDAALTWAAVTGSQVTITHIGIWDAITTGNFLWSKDVADLVYEIGEQPIIGSGNLSITITGDIGDYLYPKILDHLVGNTSYTAAATVYTALYTTDPTAADSGTEATGTGYAREATTFSAASSQATDTPGATTFGPPTASWGTPAYYTIADALTTGNLLVFGPITGISAEVLSGDTVVIAAGSYDIAWT